MATQRAKEKLFTRFSRMWFGQHVFSKQLELSCAPNRGAGIPRPCVRVGRPVGEPKRDPEKPADEALQSTRFRVVESLCRQELEAAINIVELAKEGHGEHQALRDAGDGAHE